MSADGVTRPLPRPFLVAATQNPVEYEGTYPLPEAQLDRFLLKVVLPVPPRTDEIAILTRHAEGFDPRDVAAAGVTAVASGADIEAAQVAVKGVQVSPEVATYIVDIARATRESPSLSLGVSPRGATALLRAARAWAWLSGRDFVTPDDVKALAHAALVHRLGLRPEAELEGVDVAKVLSSALGSVPVPRLVPMVISGRVPLLLLLGVVAVVLRPSGGTVALWLLALTHPRRRRPAARAHDRGGRSAPAAARHGPARRPRRVRVTVANEGNRRCAGGPRRVAAHGRRHRQPAPLSLPGGERRVLRTPFRPWRRGDLRAFGVTVRSWGPLHLAAKQRTYDVPGRSAPCHRSSRASTCRRGWRSSASSTAGRLCGSAERAPSSTRSASTSAATSAVDRLARVRAHPARGRPHLAAGARPAGGARARHLAHRRRAGRWRRRRAAAGRRDGRRTAARRARLPRR